MSESEEMTNFDVKLEEGTSYDIDFLIDAILEVSEGALDSLCSGITAFLSPKKMLQLALSSEHSVINPQNSLIIKVTHNSDNQNNDTKELFEKRVGAIILYPSSLHKIPAILNSVISKEKLAAIRPLLEHSVPDTAYINTLWIDEDYKALGLGSLLIECAIDYAKNLNLKGLSLHCFASNTKARAFYEKKGFKVYQTVEYLGAVKQSHPDGGFIYYLEF